MCYHFISIHDLINSLTLGIIAATIATALGAIAAINLFRYRYWGRKMVYNLLFIMIIKDYKFPKLSLVPQLMKILMQKCRDSKSSYSGAHQVFLVYV